MIVDKDTIAKIARLSKIELKAAEVAKLSTQLSGILEHMKVLDEVNVTGVEPMFYGCAEERALRPDTPHRFESSKICKNGFSVPNIIDGD
ncbi:MAG: Asp-tRNA(Asn)/Glu-tRNA(Gln) amidotransferase subunit GatC [Pseudomonadota bacterium]